MTYLELALDFEAHAEWALPAPSDHRLRGVTLPLRTRGQVLKMALDALQPHWQGTFCRARRCGWPNPSCRWGASDVWGGRCAHCSRARTPCCSKCASWRCAAACYGRGAWQGRERGGRMCSYWITSPLQDQGRSPCGPFSACCAGGCSATGKGQEAGPRAAWHCRRAWPYVRDTGPRPVPLACSGAPSTAASWLTKGAAWTRRKRAWRRKRRGRGCSPHSRPGLAPWLRPKPGAGGRSRGHRSTPTPFLRGAARRGRRRRPPQHEWSWTNPPPPPRGRAGATRAVSPPIPPTKKGTAGGGGNERGSHGALCRPCVISTGPQHASHARGTGGCGTAVAAPRGASQGAGGRGQRCLPV